MSCSCCLLSACSDVGSWFDVSSIVVACDAWNEANACADAGASVVALSKWGPGGSQWVGRAISEHDLLPGRLKGTVGCVCHESLAFSGAVTTSSCGHASDDKAGGRPSCLEIEKETLRRSLGKLPLAWKCSCKWAAACDVASSSSGAVGEECKSWLSASIGSGCGCANASGTWHWKL